MIFESSNESSTHSILKMSKVWQKMKYGLAQKFWSDNFFEGKWKYILSQPYSSDIRSLRSENPKEVQSYHGIVSLILLYFHGNNNKKFIFNLPELLGVLVEAAVAVAGLEPLYRGVFSLMVAVSTVFWRLKLDWILLLTLGAAVGGGPAKKNKQRKTINKHIFFRQITQPQVGGGATCCRRWSIRILRTRWPSSRLRWGRGNRPLNSIMRTGSGSRSVIGTPVWRRLWGWSPATRCTPWGVCTPACTCCTSSSHISEW